MSRNDKDDKAATKPVEPPETSTKPVEPPKAPPSGAHPDQDLPDNSLDVAEPRTDYVVQVEHSQSSTVKIWVESPGSFPSEEDAVAHLEGMAAAEYEKLKLRLAAGSQGGETGRVRIVARHTEETVVTVSDFSTPPEEVPEAEPKTEDDLV